ncbi:MAG: histidine triad nucleotide-binding protein [bacterium]|nr:histidine triad nucleotide-binding protein [bacterium]
MQDCLFCRIVAGTIPADRIHEDEHTLAFRDIQPQAPFHALVIPKAHVVSLLELDPGQAGPLMAAVQSVATQAGLGEDGFRVVSNIGRDGGQSVFHLHWHVLGGRALTWPPG